MDLPRHARCPVVLRWVEVDHRPAPGTMEPTAGKREGHVGGVPGVGSAADGDGGRAPTAPVDGTPPAWRGIALHGTYACRIAGWLVASPDTPKRSMFLTSSSDLFRVPQKN